jgi:hypothetical protein
MSLTMNDFQTKCINQCKVLFAQYPFLGESNFEPIQGSKESYFKAEFSIQDRRLLEVFIYEDEAGFMVGGKEWTICEKPDYSSPDHLISGFIEKINKKLSEHNPRSLDTQ